MRGSPTSGLVEAIRRSYRRLHADNTRLLLAVSGGADSLALLHATHAVARELCITFEVATVNHGLRDESAAECEFVAALCSELGVRCEIVNLKLLPGSALEERARNARYQALHVLLEERAFDFVVTAHTANDQAETLLMRLARGASLRGARGILEKTERHLRPFLRVQRAQTVEFVHQLGLSPVQDPHNADSSFERVRFRQSVLPALAQAVGHLHVVDHLAQFAQGAAEDEALLQSLAEQARARIEQDGGLEAVGFRALVLPLRRRVLAQWFESLGYSIDLQLLEKGLDAASRSGRVQLGEDATLETAGSVLRVVRRLADSRPAPWVAQVDENLPPHDNWRGFHSLALPLEVRTRKQGDRVRLSNGSHKKVQDLLVDARVAREVRDKIPLVVDAQGEVLWVLGVWPPPRLGRFPYYVTCQDRRSASADEGASL